MPYFIAISPKFLFPTRSPIFAKKNMSQSSFAAIEQLSSATQIGLQSLNKVLELLESGATIPFIARYRKEQTGGLDEVKLAEISREYTRIKDLISRKESILTAISEQGKLTAELREKIRNCADATKLEDIYLPYKKKRKTRADRARELGLEPLAKMIFSQKNYHPEQSAERFVGGEVTSTEHALQLSRDIMAEWINENTSVRALCRSHFRKSGELIAEVVKGKEEEGRNFRDYFNFSQPLFRIPSHRILAIFRAEKEGFLRVKVRPEEENLSFALEKRLLRNDSACAKEVQKAIRDSLKRLLLPSMETEFRKLIKERADVEAIAVFESNLKQLLLAPPLGAVNVLALDPAYRTGCKTVCLNSSGDLVWNGTIFPLPPQNKIREAEAKVLELCEKFQIQAIAIGNGTGGKEAIEFIKGIKPLGEMQTYLVNEAGASVYSASSVAIEEFPDYDLTVRGAVSIGRRLMDPMAELVKIDPKHIGVGQYQHDVDQKLLSERLKEVVELCVNSVGINLNTASKHLLNYVSGLGPSLAQSIVDFRTENGAFAERSELKKVKGMGPVAFEQSAGFLRVRNGKNPLDNTGVHPERYGLVAQMAADLNIDLSILINSEDLRNKIDIRKYMTDEVGKPTLLDILKELEKPGLDPRGKAKEVRFSNIRSIEDLREGMIVSGVVSNLAKFGAFVDLGIKAGGLIHISEIANRFLKDPAEVLSLGQQVDVKVLEVDLERGRVKLSLKGV